jgi:hypothetical protein
LKIDQYAYVALDFIDVAHPSLILNWKNSSRKQLGYWRNHFTLQDWMAELFERKGRPGKFGKFRKNMLFNGIEIELLSNDIDDLEASVLNGDLPTTEVFPGNVDKNYYLDHDREFISRARSELILGRRVFYLSYRDASMVENRIN